MCPWLYTHSYTQNTNILTQNKFYIENNNKKHVFSFLMYYQALSEHFTCFHYILKSSGH